MKTKIAKTILLAVLAGTVSAGTLNDGPSAPGKLVLERPAASERPERRKSAEKPAAKPAYGKWSVKFNGKKHKPEDFMCVCIKCGKTYCHKRVLAAGRDSECAHLWSFVPVKKSGKHKH